MLIPITTCPTYPNPNPNPNPNQAWVKAIPNKPILVSLSTTMMAYSQAATEFNATLDVVVWGVVGYGRG